jgi:hypothetical protein
MSCPSHLAWLDYSNYIWHKSTNYETSHYATFSDILQLYPTNLFPSTLSLWSSLNVRGQVSHPYKSTGNVTVFYILIFYCRSQIFLGCYIFKGCNYLPVMIFIFILVTRYQRLLGFLCFLPDQTPHEGQLKLLLFSLWYFFYHQNRPEVDESHFSPTCFSWTLLMTYSKSKLEINDDNASPRFREF